MNTAYRLRPRSLRARALRARSLFLGAERGSMDGGSYSDLVYMPFLIGLLLFGLVIGLVGFYRVGASYATQQSVQVGAVSPEQGDSVLSALWRGWSSASTTPGDFVVDEEEHTVRANINGSRSFEFYTLGAYEFNISAGSGVQARLERFYPGQPDDGGEGGDE